MESSAVQIIKLAIVAATGLSKDALHIYVGLMVFLGGVFVTRRPIGSLLPWLMVLVVAIAGELVDMRDDLVSIGYWRWLASTHDIVNTLVWPSVLLGLARYSSVFGGGARRR